MEKKAVSGIMLTLLSISMLTLASNIQPVKASGTIYIRADGSVDPDTTPISTLDNITYYFANNIYDEIVVQRNNIVVDGAGYTLQGTGASDSIGIDLTGRSNVTIKNTNIRGFFYGVYLNLTSCNTISGNNITDNDWNGIRLISSSNNSIYGNNITANDLNGIYLKDSSNNSISGNNITSNESIGVSLGMSSGNTISGNNIRNNANYGVGLYFSSNNNAISRNNITNNEFTDVVVFSSSSNTISGNNIRKSYTGVALHSSSKNTISGNNITNNGNYGILLDMSSDNTISGNNITTTNDCSILLGFSHYNSIYKNDITKNQHGIELYASSNNKFYHNNIMDNTEQVYTETSGFANFWDDGYPSGGNYWSDYTTRYPDAQELDDSGIWDTPYVIDKNNQDNYPLMEPWTPSPPIPRTIDELKTEIEECWSEGEIDNQGIVRSFMAKLNVAQKLVDKGKAGEAKSILEDALIPQVQNLSGICITVEAADILIKSAEYIISQL